MFDLFKEFEKGSLFVLVEGFSIAGIIASLEIMYDLKDFVVFVSEVTIEEGEIFVAFESICFGEEIDSHSSISEFAKKSLCKGCSVGLGGKKRSESAEDDSETESDFFHFVCWRG